MKVTRHDTADEFLRHAQPWLIRREAENSLVLAACANLASQPDRYQGPPLLLVAQQNGDVAGAAAMAPGQDLAVAGCSPEAVDLLVRSAVELPAAVAAVDGPAPTSRAFAQRWADRTGGSYWLAMKHRILRCQRLIAPDYCSGKLRPAGQGDLELLSEWRRDYREEVGHDVDGDHLAVVRSRAALGQLFVWDDGRPVSMVGCGDETPNSVRLFLVFTPPEFRNSGYATSCVAALTGRILDRPKRSCFLCADLANTASNAVYQKVGYRPVCDCQTWFLDDE